MSEAVPTDGDDDVDRRPTIVSRRQLSRMTTSLDVAVVQQLLSSLQNYDSMSNDAVTIPGIIGLLTLETGFKPEDVSILKTVNRFYERYLQPTQRQADAQKTIASGARASLNMLPFDTSNEQIRNLAGKLTDIVGLVDSHRSDFHRSNDFTRQLSLLVSFMLMITSLSES